MAVHLKQFPSGKWGLVIYADSGRKVKVVGSKSAAQRLKPVIEQKLAAQSLGAIKRGDTFKDVATRYMEFITLHRAPKTVTRYQGLLDQYILPRIGSEQISQLTRGTLRDALQHVYKRGASRSSVELMHTVMSGVFQHALDEELITDMPTRLLLKRFGFDRKQDSIEPLSEAEILAALEVIRDDYYPLFALLYETGMRIGEALALEWSDINFFSRYITVSKTAVNQAVRPTTKTYVKRNVDVSERLFSVLANLNRQDKKRCFSLGIPQHHVFNVDGRILSDNTIRREWTRACKKIGIGHRRIHDIRHTTASILLMRGADPLSVSKLLGHSSVAITLSVYAHWIPREGKKIVELLNRERKVKNGAL